jgi:hypothetical protein
MDLTDWVAVVALALGLLNAGWAFYAWTHQGPRIKVSAAHDAGPPGLLNPTDLVVVRVHNTGRGGATISRAGFLMPDGQPMPPIRKRRIRLEGHDSAEIRFDAETFAGELPPGEAIRLVPFVILGNGDQRTGKPLELSGPPKVGG